MICITGIPGAGKSTLCRNLSEYGIKCTAANDEAELLGCISGEDVDVDLLRGRLNGIDIVEGHYSQLLDCEAVIIMKASENTIRRRLTEKGYSREKIDENIDSMFSGTIYYEALDRLPANRIFTLDSDTGDEKSVLEEAVKIISRITANNKS